MKCNAWTLALIGAGLVSLPAVARAEESTNATPALLTSLAATTLSGYVDTSAEWNPGTGNANMPPYAFGGSSKADGFNLDVVELRLEKPVNAADLWGAGYRVDLLAGPDANSLATQSFFGNGSKAGPSDFAVKAAYVTLHAPVGNGLDFKIGTWDTIIGYEVFEAGNNPNFTHSYGYTLEPTTHTGVLATYQFNDVVSASVGVANTFGPAINERDPVSHTESYKTYMGSVTFTAPTNTGFLAGSTLTACIINGFNSGTAGNETSYYAGATVNTPVTWLKFGAAFDDLDVADAHGENWCVGGYASVQATEKLSFYARAEYLKDRGDQKLFVAPNESDPTTFHATAPDQALGLTFTAQYDLWKNVISRLEVRWDHSLSSQGVWGGTTPNDTAAGSTPGDQKNAVLIAANFIYKF
jgi:hypothetical protein